MKFHHFWPPLRNPFGYTGKIHYCPPRGKIIRHQHFNPLFLKHVEAILSQQPEVLKALCREKSFTCRNAIYQTEFDGLYVIRKTQYPRWLLSGWHRVWCWKKKRGNRGRPQKFFQGEQTRHLAYPFHVADDAVQMHVHKTLCPFYTITKMPPATARVTKIALRWRLGAAMLLFTLHSTKLRSLPLSAVTVSQRFLPKMFAFYSHMRQNTYDCNLKWTSADLLPCYCYAIKTNDRTIRSQALQHASASAGEVADMSELQAHHCMAPEQRA